MGLPHPPRHPVELVDVPTSTSGGPVKYRVDMLIIGNEAMSMKLSIDMATSRILDGGR